MGKIADKVAIIGLSERSLSNRQNFGSGESTDFMKNLLKDKINKYRDRVEFLEIRLEQQQKQTIRFIYDQLETPIIGTNCGNCIRTFHQGGWGFTTFNDTNDIDAMVENAISQAKITAASAETYHLAPVVPIVTDVPLVVVNDPLQVTIDQKIDILKAYNDIILSHGGNIKSSIAMYSDSHRKKYYGNSEGALISQETVDLSCFISATAIKDGVSQTLYFGSGSSNDFNIMYGMEQQTQAICREVEELVDAPKVRAGVYPVILNPTLAGTFAHESFGHTVEADHIMSNPDLMETLQIGKTFGTEKITIYDSGVEVGSRGYIAYDDEGVPGQKTYLLKNGILVGHMHSRETAARMRATPTGNARALNCNHPPICRMRVTCIEAGNDSLEEMLAGIDEGVLAIDSRGGSGGEMFSFAATKGYMIRNGKIAELVRDVKLSGNLFQTLKNVDMVGNDQHIIEKPGGCGKGKQFPLPVAAWSPYVRIQNVTMGGA